VQISVATLPEGLHTFGTQTYNQMPGLPTHRRSAGARLCRPQSLHCLTDCKPSARGRHANIQSNARTPYTSTLRRSTFVQTSVATLLDGLQTFLSATARRIQRETTQQDEAGSKTTNPMSQRGRFKRGGIQPSASVSPHGGLS
jgi:hypothetical protein